MIKRMYLIGDITYEAYETFTKELSNLERGPANPKKIILELSSMGGDAYVSLAFYSRIRNSKIPIHIIGNGFIASAAVLILAAGHTRAMTKESWVMVHEESEEMNCEVHQAERMIKHQREMENQADRILEERTGTPAKEWKDMHTMTTYLTSQECLDTGLIGEIV